MNTTGAYRLVLPLGLLLLALCSTGLARNCFQCGWTDKGCSSQQICDAGLNTCMKVTQKSMGTSYYACVSYDKCNVEDVRGQLGLPSASISLLCCQEDLCNSGITSLPASGLILFLASALLILFS